MLDEHIIEINEQGTTLGMYSSTRGTRGVFFHGAKFNLGGLHHAARTFVTCRVE